MAIIGDLRIWGGVGVGLWFATFAIGTLVPSCPHRRALDPTLPPECRTAPDGTPAAREEAVGASLEIASVLGAAPAQAVSPPNGAAYAPEVRPTVRALLVGAMTYTPCNLALLAIVAGLVGGCASRLTWRDANPGAPDGSAAPPAPESGPDAGSHPAAVQRDPQSLRYLRENPVSSMCRQIACAVSS